MIDYALSFFFSSSVLLFSLGQLGRLSFYNQHVNVYAYEISLAALVFFLFLKYKTVPLAFFKQLSLPLLSFLGVSIAALVWGAPTFNSTQNGIALLYFLRLFTYLFAFPFLLYHFSHHLHSKNVLMNATRFILSTTIISATMQYLFYPNLRNLMYLGWDPHLYRVFGVYFEPYLAASIFGLLFFYVLEYKPSHVHKNTVALFKIGQAMIISVLFILILLTFSRTAYLAITFCTTVYLLLKRKWLFVALFILAFGCVVYLLPKPEGVGINLARTFSIVTRFEDMKSGVLTWTKNPVFGIGYNRVGYVRAVSSSNLGEQASHAAFSYHSSFVTVLVSTGIVGLAFFLWYVGSLAVLSSTTRSMFIYVSCISLGDNALLHPFILFMLLILTVAAYISRPSHT